MRHRELAGERDVVHVRSARHASARRPEAELIRAVRTAVQLAVVIGGQVAVQHPRVEHAAAALRLHGEVAVAVDAALCSGG